MLYRCILFFFQMTYNTLDFNIIQFTSMSIPIELLNKDHHEKECNNLVINMKRHKNLLKISQKCDICGRRN